MSKQTAMQILFNRNQEIIDRLEFSSNPMQVEYRKALVSVNDDIDTEMLAMEKEQIRLIYEGLLQNVGTSIKQSDLPTFEQYYNETYKKD